MRNLTSFYTPPLKHRGTNHRVRGRGHARVRAEAGRGHSMRTTTQLLILCIATAAHQLSLGPRLRPAVRLPPPACVLETKPLDEQALGSLVEQWQRADEEKLMGSVAPTKPIGSSARQRADSAASAADESSHGGGPESARLTRARQRLASLISDADGSVAPDDMFPSLGYSPAAAAERFGGQWSSVGLRQLRLVGPIARFIAKVVLDVQASPAACSLQPAARAATATAYARHAHCVHSSHMHRMHALLSSGRRRGGAQAAARRRADRSDLRPRARSHQGRPGALLAPTLALSLANPNPNPNPNQGKAPSSRSDPNPGPDPSPDPKPNPHQALSSRSDLLPAEHLRRVTHAVLAVAGLATHGPRRPGAGARWPSMPESGSSLATWLTEQRLQ